MMILQMQLAHPGENGLARLLVGLEAQRGVLAGKLLQAERHLLDALLGLRLNRDVDDGHREGHPLQHHRIIGGGERVTRAGILEADEGCNVAGRDLLDLRPLVRVHLEHAADTLAIVLGRVHHGVARLQHAGIDAHEGQRAVFVVDDLEGEAGEGRVRVGRDHAAAWPAPRECPPRLPRPRP